MPTNMPTDDATTTRVSVQISDRLKSQLNDIAYEKSRPGEVVNASHVIREALIDYVERYCSDPEACSPRERGAPRSTPDVEDSALETNEGAA